MTNMTLEAAKAIIWEEAKGKLRALVALQGSYTSGENTDKYEKIDIEVEQFINHIENHGLQE